MMYKSALIVACFALASCAAPGAQKVLPAGSAGAVPSCQTLSTDAPTTAFVQGSYLTTWGSAVREGAAAGVRDGLNDGSALGSVLLTRFRTPSTYKGQNVITVNHKVDPFCMAFNAPFTGVNAAVARAFSELKPLGFQVSSFAGEVPSYETSFNEGRNLTAKWIERLVGVVERLPDGRSLVVISRGIYIARDESGYYQGNSIGQNEAAILTRIRDIIGN